MSESEASVLDTASLQRLAELDPTGKGRVVQRVLSAFQGSVLRLGPQLGEATAQGDLNAIRHIAHTLKSSSASVGALHLSRLCAEIETLIREERRAEVDSRVQAMTAELDLVLQALRPLLAAPP